MRTLKRGVTHPLNWFLPLIAGVALSVGLASPALAAGGPPIGRIYDCYSYNYLSGFLNYVQALELKTKTTYLVAPARKGNHLSGRAAKGAYKRQGSKATFLTGPYGQLHWYGMWKPKHTDAAGYTDKANLGLFTPKGQSATERTANAHNIRQYVAPAPRGPGTSPYLEPHNQSPPAAKFASDWKPPPDDVRRASPADKPSMEGVPLTV